MSNLLLIVIMLPLVLVISYISMKLIPIKTTIREGHVKYIINMIDDKGIKYIVRRLSIVYEFNFACPMRYPRCLNLIRTKTKKQAERFIKKAKQLDAMDYEGLKTLVKTIKSV